MTSKIVLGGRTMALFVGTNGSGKTVATASWPGRGLILDFDGRVDPVRLFYPNRDDIEYWTIGLDGDQRPDCLGFSEGIKKIEDLQDRCPYDWVSMDSYTSYSAVAVLHQMGLHAGDVKKTKGGLPIPDWDEYKGETGVMLQILEILKILPCNIFVTAHPIQAAKTTKQGGSTNDVLASMIKGQSIASYGWKTPSLLPNYFNEMWHFWTDVTPHAETTNRRWVQTVSAGEIVAKTALPLPAKFEITDKPCYNVVQAFLKEYNIKMQAKQEALQKG
jgi:hypothetical protein